jgi:hypothetical protein
MADDLCPWGAFLGRLVELPLTFAPMSELPAGFSILWKLGFGSFTASAVSGLRWR